MARSPGFTPLSGSFFSITEDASPKLKALAMAYPKLLSRALRHLAFRVKDEITATIRSGGPVGTRWPERSRMHRYRRMDMLRQGGISKYFGLKRKIGHQLLRGEDLRRKKMMDRWKQPGKFRAVGAMQGFLEKSIRYQAVSKNRVDIGAISPNAARFLEKVQTGKRQPVTTAMRRAFWAAGIPLDNATVVLEQDPRPLIDPVFQKLRPHFEAILIARMEGYLRGEQAWLDLPR